RREFRAADDLRKAGGCQESRDNAGVGVEKRSEDILPDSGRADQGEVLEPSKARMKRWPGADLGRLLDHRPALGDELGVAGAAVVAFESPRDQGGLVDGWCFPLRPPVDRVFLDPVAVGSILSSDAREPSKDAATYVSMPRAIECSAGGDGVPRPAIGVDSSIEPRCDRTPLTVSMETRGERGTAKDNGIGCPGKAESRQRLDEVVPLFSRPMFDIVNATRAKPGESRSDPMLEGSVITVPAGEGAADEQIDCD